ncbi:MAG: asparaginase [Candidatus Eisenbacteria bacterium]|nr:asparaginase [Candidatus Eisenbacteria bacterium]
MRLQVDGTVWRGAIPESRHRMQAVVTDASGRAVLETSESGLVTTFRSAAKPFQALPLVERGHAERWKITDEELAVLCASHTGSAYHVALVTGILDRLGLTESALACGYHDPLDPESLAELRARADGRSPVYNNCSGKHAGMLCLAMSEGWPTLGYERADHPVQQLMRRSIAEMCGVAPESLLTAIDGCSVTVFALPLDAMARGYARLAGAAASGDGRERALARIRGAMMGFPAATGGRGRFSSDLMAAAPGRLVAKGGAEGLECVGLTGEGWGLAIKSEDGSARALPTAVIALLEQLGALSREELARLEPLSRPRIRNTAGLDVGTIEVTLRSTARATA